MADLAEKMRTKSIKWSIFLCVMLAILCLFGWIAMEEQRKLEDLR